MKEGMDTDQVIPPSGGFRYPGLYCGVDIGPDGWHFLRPGDEDPLIPGHTIADRAVRSMLLI